MPGDKSISELRLGLNEAAGMLRQKFRIKRRVDDDESWSDYGLAPSLQALTALAKFVGTHPDLGQELRPPIDNLLAALGDVAKGVQHPMLKPWTRSAAPGSGLRDERIMATAAICLHVLMASGMPKRRASQFVAGEMKTNDIGTGPNRRSPSARTIESWRDRGTQHGDSAFIKGRIDFIETLGGVPSPEKATVFTRNLIRSLGRNP